MIERVGVAFPAKVDALSKIRTELPPWFATKRRLAAVSTSMCCGEESVVLLPVTIAIGAILLFAVRALLKRRIPLGVETNNWPPVPPVVPPVFFDPHPAANMAKIRTAYRRCI